VGEWLDGPSDEGIHNLARSLSAQWETTCSVRTVSIGGDFRVNRLFLSRRLRKTLREIGPDTIVYISPSSAKVAALFRTKMMKTFLPRSRVFVIATQPVTYGVLERPFARLLSPDGIFVQFPSGTRGLRGIRCPVHFLPSGVDTKRFMPADETRKRDLRATYKVDEDAFVVLHVGHVNRGRNVRVLERVARMRGIQVILVGSTSTRQDEDLAHELQQAGVRVVREFIPRIEDLYQLADAYVFPVMLEDAAIGVPLSVLEAMACNLRVITTPFGGLPSMFQEGDGFIYFEDEGGLPALIDEARKLPAISTRRIVEPYDWKMVASEAMELMKPKESLR
jgi:glycosyltransferase involved in cell wall biosynthesis